jgi:DNA/RNA-binding domain of Phe-tRNA-synthetase-like protein
VFGLVPGFRLLALVVDGLPGGPSDGTSHGWLRAAAEQAVAAGPVEADPHVLAWREAFRAFGAKPQRTRPSVEALLRRAADGLPEVGRAVDAYNAVSVAHRLPIGGEDLDRCAGSIRLVRAAGNEPFDTVHSGQPAIEHPEPGEVVWRDEAGVTCRRWNWRQCGRTRITADTTRALFVLEWLLPNAVDDLLAAGRDLLNRLAPDGSLEYAARLMDASGWHPVELRRPVTK